MEPANLHELVIAQTVDKNFREGPTDRHSIIRDVVVSLDFEMSPSDSRFLVAICPVAACSLDPWSKYELDPGS
jgi:hypothetical protein